MENVEQKFQLSEPSIELLWREEESTTSPSETESNASADNDDPLELLRSLLLEHYRQRLRGLEQETIDAQQKLQVLEHRLNDTTALKEAITPIIAASIQSKIREAPYEMAEALSPIIADALRSSIAESREAMIEALYPITGKLVQRAVSEAMRDLARKIDEQMRTTFNFASILQRVRMMLGLAPSSESMLRDLLPFQVEEIFLIHRQTGILLRHETAAALRAGANKNASDPAQTAQAEPQTQAETQQQDNQLIGSMLTAIRDFVNDVFGRGEQGQLTEVQYGDKLILLEAAHFCYLAVVITGVEATGYRAQMREVIFAIDNEHLRSLREFSGDTSLFANTSEQLKKLYIAGNEA